MTLGLGTYLEPKLGPSGSAAAGRAPGAAPAPRSPWAGAPGWWSRTPGFGSAPLLPHREPPAWGWEYLPLGTWAPEKGGNGSLSGRGEGAGPGRRAPGHPAPAAGGQRLKINSRARVPEPGSRGGEGVGDGEPPPPASLPGPGAWISPRCPVRVPLRTPTLLSRSVLRPPPAPPAHVTRKV